MPVVMLKMTTGARVIYDLQENHSKKIAAREWFTALLGGPAAWTIGRLESITAKLVDGIVAVTEEFASQFPPEKTCVGKNQPLLAMTAASSDCERIDEGNRDLIYTGRFTNHRGLVQVVEALALVENKTPKARLLFLGRAVDHLAERVARELPGLKRVEYLDVLA